MTYFGARGILKRSQPYFKEQAAILGRMNGYVQGNCQVYCLEPTVVRILHKEFLRLQTTSNVLGFKAAFRELPFD